MNSVIVTTETTLTDLQRIEVTSLDDWRDWLQSHHGQTSSIWVVTWRKSRGPHVPYGDIRDEALCFGWIDSRPAKLDANRSMLLLSPRKERSGWSRVNKERIAVLEAEGRLQAPGQAKIAAAKRDGSWNALDDAHALVVPDDLAQALAMQTVASESFVAFSPSSRRGILEWIASAKRPETRARRIQETVRLAVRGLRANHPESRDA